MLKLNTIYHSDCIKAMKKIDDKSIDMILCDLPYGITRCKWDSIIPLDQLWNEYLRIAKNSCPIVLSCTQPFTSHLLLSQINLFKYELIWYKNSPSGFAFAKYQPLRYHENVLVFCKGKHKYYPQKAKRFSKASEEVCKRFVHSGADKSEHSPMGSLRVKYGILKNSGSVIECETVPNAGFHKLHPTQKPLGLYEYLIKSYSDENDIVLDNCCGSGTTGVACKKLNRNYILIDNDRNYCLISAYRISGKLNEAEQLRQRMKDANYKTEN